MFKNNNTNTSTTTPPGNNNFHNIIASATGTSIAEILTLPVCTIKTNVQTNLQYKIPEVVKQIYKTRGIYGFYNSALPAISSQVVSTASKYTFYSMIKNYRNTSHNDLGNNMMNGCAAGIMSTCFTHPIDVVKIHQQQNKQMLSVIKQEGLPVFYRGISKSLSKNIVLTGTLFPIYDFYKSHVNNVSLSALYTSLTISSILHPIDYLKTRHISNLPLFQGYNIMNYYRGFSLNLMRSVPHFMMTMYITEGIKRVLYSDE